MPHFVNYSRVDKLDVESFISRFNRVPKNWTLDQMHDLWIRATDRANKRQKDHSDCIKEISRDIPVNSKKEHIVYFYSRYTPKYISCYNIRYDSSYRTHLIGRNSLELKNREDKLDFILSNEKSFELGQKLHDIDLLITNLQYRVKEIICNIVNEKLRDKLKDTYVSSNNIFIVKIGTKKYFFQSDDRGSGYGYNRFHMRGECSDNVIELE